jgi:hypothetical protein
MTKTIGVNVILGNATITLILLERDGVRLVEGFQNGSLDLVVGGTTVDGQKWSFRPAECKGLFTFDIEKVQQQAGYGAMQGPVGNRLSGI